MHLLVVVLLYLQVPSFLAYELKCDAINETNFCYCSNAHCDACEPVKAHGGCCYRYMINSSWRCTSILNDAPPNATMTCSSSCVSECKRCRARYPVSNVSRCTDCYHGYELAAGYSVCCLSPCVYLACCLIYNSSPN